jgi:GAF domain-containing protein
MESITIASGDKKNVYESLLPQIFSLIEAEEDTCANLANITAVLKEAFSFLWVGFYLVKPDKSQLGKSLVLGPFQGPLACTRIQYGKGVCGTSWKEAKTIIVPDVEYFPGHIACSSLSRSEIVVPVFRNSEVVAVLDIDSLQPDTFDEIDEYFLVKLTSKIRIA